MSSRRKLLRVYVDETGDRGRQATSSPYFAFAAVLIADEDEPELRATMSMLRREMKVPHARALHWKDHVKTFPRRQYVSRSLSAVDGLKIIYVVVEKAAIPAGSGMRLDHAIFYNYAAGFVLERALLAAKDWHDGPRDLVIRYGHVKGFDHTTTASYFRQKPSQGPSWVPWHLLRGQPRFEDQANWDGLQAADMYAGMLHVAALRTDDFGGYEEHHLLKVRQQIRRNRAGNCWGWGFKWLGNEATVKSLPWWPSEGL
ncbi:DUF3800 domain-containing protein [Actinomadura oligospora]|uniref:DUF3800 domain-containing protein n=1 Tax=Actinomadura oligospora TaxID=111804 RepID=UPI0014753FEC|nr:DUF3800 domain-containing protein [Actinomadura oligospora]